MTAMPLFSHLEDSQADADHSIILTEQDGRVSIICDGVEEVACALPEFVPSLKAMLLEKLLATPGYEVALHVASLLKNDRLLLLSAQSGVGKSTLTAALLQNGFGYCGDDLALVDKLGRARGAPFAITLKSGASVPLASFIPALTAQPIFSRLDRKRVRYLVPGTVASVVAERVGWIVVLKREQSAKTMLNRIDKMDALRLLLKSGYSREGRLTTFGFKAMVAMLNGAECFRLTYSDLGEAVALLEGVCR